MMGWDFEINKVENQNGICLTLSKSCNHEI
jgi:hypothetical protein